MGSAYQPVLREGAADPGARCRQGEGPTRGGGCAQPRRRDYGGEQPRGPASSPSHPGDGQGEPARSPHQFDRRGCSLNKKRPRREGLAAVTSFLLRRLALVLPTLFFVSVLIFGLQQLLPGDPALALAGEDRDPAVIAFLRQKYHLDEPLPVRYILWVEGVLSGDLGESIRIKRPVRDLVLEKLPVTAELAALAIVIALSIGLPMGILAAIKNNSVVDYIATMTALWGRSIPNFWLGILLILLFSVEWGL